jgi:2-polyprenyl-3-methyl-5-hydroxy-6-metoxy-1,4-benzoquinol methylase
MEPVDIDSIYQKVPLDRIPWNMENPPDALVAFIESGKISPCRAVDLGCGTGNYALYLATRGFEMTGIDSSPTAIRIARTSARTRGVCVSFVVADLLGDLHEVRERFDFAFDWEVLHHIFPDDREKYAHNVHTLLNPGGLYLTVSFSERDPQFGGRGKIRNTPLGTVLYFSSEHEIETMLSSLFTVLELKTIEIGGRFGSHCAVYALSRRK